MCSLQPQATFPRRVLITPRQHGLPTKQKMAVRENHETTDVVVVGCGPTGALLTTLLGSFNIPNIVLEREAGITEDPRGIALDEDGIRLLQAVGIYDKIYTEIGSCE